MSLNIGIDVNGDIEKIVMDTYLNVVNDALSKAQGSIQVRLGELVVQEIRSSDTYKSLLSGPLQGHFGLADPVQVLTEMDNLLLKSIFFDFTKFRYPKASISGKFLVGIVKDDFKEFLNAAFGVYISENENSTSYEIAWFKWLMTKGDKIIISDYHVVFSKAPGFVKNSRSGFALMLKGGAWRVPPEHSGTLKDNFITRALLAESFQSAAIKIIEEEITKFI